MQNVHLLDCIHTPKFGLYHPHSNFDIRISCSLYQLNLLNSPQLLHNIRNMKRINFLQLVYNRGSKEYDLFGKMWKKVHVLQSLKIYSSLNKTASNCESYDFGLGCTIFHVYIIIIDTFWVRNFKFAWLIIFLIFSVFYTDISIPYQPNVHCKYEDRRYFSV